MIAFYFRSIFLSVSIVWYLILNAIYEHLWKLSMIIYIFNKRFPVSLHVEYLVQDMSKLSVILCRTKRCDGVNKNKQVFIQAKIRPCHKSKRFLEIDHRSLFICTFLLMIINCTNTNIPYLFDLGYWVRRPNIERLSYLEQESRRAYGTGVTRIAFLLN